METKQYIILDQNGKFINTVLWDGDLNKWSPPAGTIAVLQDDVDKGVSLNTSVETLYTAEQWVENNNFSSLQVIGLLDLENKLNKLEIVSEKLTAVRLWLDGILLAYAENNLPRNDWPVPPYSFDETVKEVKQLLGL